MHETQTVDRFIELRSQGWTYQRLMAELKVSKPTLIQWSRKHQFQIQNLRAIELETLADRWLASTADRVNALGEKLRQVETELSGRDVKELSTSQLHSLASHLRRQIEQATGCVRFTTPAAEIPRDEYHDQVQDWHG